MNLLSMVYKECDYNKYGKIDKYDENKWLRLRCNDELDEFRECYEHEEFDELDKLDESKETDSRLSKFSINE